MSGIAYGKPHGSHGFPPSPDRGGGDCITRLAPHSFQTAVTHPDSDFLSFTPEIFRVGWRWMLHSPLCTLMDDVQGCRSFGALTPGQRDSKFLSFLTTD